MAAKLGQLLTTSQVITEEQLKEAVGLQRKEGGRLGTNLVKLGYITEEKLVAFLSKQWGVPAMTLSDYKIDPSVLKLIPIEIARKYLIIPVARVGATLTIAMADPSNVFVIDDVKFMTGFNVDVVVSSESSILQCHIDILPQRRRGADCAEEGICKGSGQVYPCKRLYSFW